mgnify:CR=1 FL=1
MGREGNGHSLEKRHATPTSQFDSSSTDSGKPTIDDTARRMDDVLAPSRQKIGPMSRCRRRVTFLVEISGTVHPLCFLLSTVIRGKTVNACVVARLLVGITELTPMHRLGAVRPAPSLCRAPLSGYVHSQILPFELPSASTSYSNTAAMPFSLANFSEFV